MSHQYIFKAWVLCLAAAVSACGSESTSDASPTPGAEEGAGQGATTPPATPDAPMDSTAEPGGETPVTQGDEPATPSNPGTPTTDEPGSGMTDTGEFPELEAGGPEPSYLQPVHDGWEVLMVADWELDAGVEGYYCARVTLEEDLYFNATVPVSPAGTHHTLLSLVSSPSKPDGIEPCNAGTNGDIMITGSGVGTEAISYPEGVAMFAPKGSQLLLNLHLFNATDDAIEGRSGTLVKTVPAEDVSARATTTLAGPISLNIPEGRVTQNGRCTIKKDVTLVFVSPHMHQLGVHLRGVAKHVDGSETLLYDDEYDFYEQRIYPIEPVELSAGDTVEVECTYENDSGKTVRFGDSSLSEMCFLSLFHYPEMGGSTFICPS